MGIGNKKNMLNGAIGIIYSECIKLILNISIQLIENFAMMLNIYVEQFYENTFYELFNPEQKNI